jgi:hypothetical protein
LENSTLDLTASRLETVAFTSTLGTDPVVAGLHNHEASQKLTHRLYRLRPLPEGIGHSSRIIDEPALCEIREFSLLIIMVQGNLQ